MISKIALGRVSSSSVRFQLKKKIVNKRKYSAPSQNNQHSEELKRLGLHDLHEVPHNIVEMGVENIEKFNQDFLQNVHDGTVPHPTTFEGQIASIKSMLIQKSTPEQVEVFERIVSKFTKEDKAMFLEYSAGSDSILRSLTTSYGAEGVSKFLARCNAITTHSITPEKPEVTVSISGAAGQIAYSLIFRIASGAMFGDKTPVHLRLLDLPVADAKLEGVRMELEDCAFPLVRSITTATDPKNGFEGADWVLLVGGTPRTKGMERKDLILKNAEVFRSQGLALSDVAKGNDTRVLVVGNPANTNAWIASQSCRTIRKENFAAMTRLDYNRGVSLLSQKLGCGIKDIKRFVIWGNHSATQFPDISHAYVGDKLVSNSVDKKWLTDTFIPTVQQRGAAVIAARGASSAASAANAVVDNIRDWYQGTRGAWSSVAVPSNGEYGVTPGVFYSYPVVYENLNYAIVEQLPIDQFAAERMEATHKELLEEIEVVRPLLKQ